MLNIFLLLISFLPLIISSCGVIVSKKNIPYNGVITSSECDLSAQSPDCVKVVVYGDYPNPYMVFQITNGGYNAITTDDIKNNGGSYYLCQKGSSCKKDFSYEILASGPTDMTGGITFHIQTYNC